MKIINNEVLLDKTEKIMLDDMRDFIIGTCESHEDDEDCSRCPLNSYCCNKYSRCSFIIDFLDEMVNLPTS